jgi:cardiolipin synthase
VPFDVVRRNHRKSIVVDDQVAFVTGLCVADCWAGDARKGIEPWRDTGVELRGPAVLDVARAFAETWAETGPPLPPEERPRIAPGVAGDVALRVVAGTTMATAAFRLDTLVAALAGSRLWLADAYFAGTAAYVQALRAAAQDGVDVRLLVPGAGTDNTFVQSISRAGYRSLLEAGVRVFEWNGPMMHAKTAVADSRWSRIGSTNLNINSWLGNWELDVAIEDTGIAKTMETHYLEDLSRSTEIVLERPRAVPSARFIRPIGRPGQARRVVRAVTGVGRSLGAAVTGNRALETFERRPLVFAFVMLIAVALVSFLAPRAVAWPIAALALWGAATFLVEALSITRRKHNKP